MFNSLSVESVKEINEALRLMNSMILSGEYHSHRSKELFKKAVSHTKDCIDYSESRSTLIKAY